MTRDRDSIRTYVNHTVGSNSKGVYVKAKCKEKAKGHIQLYNLDHRAGEKKHEGQGATTL